MQNNNKRKLLVPLSANALADVYLQLSSLEQAGLSVQQTFDLLKNTDQKINGRIQQLQKYLKLGRSIAESGVKAGVFNASDKDLLTAGESSGELGNIYRQLAEYYTGKAKRARRIKSQCYLPAITLIIAVFLQPLPALITSKISGLDYLLVSVGLLFKIALFAYILFKLHFWLTKGWLKFLGLGNLIHQLQFTLPLISSWMIERQINRFFQSLGMMLTAGLPAVDALTKSINTISNPLLRNKFEPVISSAFKGESLTDALTEVSEIDRQSIQLLLAGEKSGKLAETILHLSNIENEKINLQEELLAEWIPRVFYFIVVCWVAFSIIGNNPFRPIPI